MIDGNPGYPDLSFQWRLAEETGATFMGLSPAFTMACRKDGLEPGRRFDLSSIRTVCEAGSPLPPEGYAWLYEQLGPDLFLNVGSGGTDVCSGLLSGYPILPVYAGEITAPCLGVDAVAFDLDGRPVIGELGELVIRRPMPSMPVGFWNDPDGSRYRSAYFEHYPGVWRHGDWILFTERGSCVITGRSDATLNRGGVRLGTSELYGVVEEMDEVLDSLVVHLEQTDDLLLFVVLRDGVALDDALRAPDRGRAPHEPLPAAPARRDRRRARRSHGRSPARSSSCRSSGSSPARPSPRSRAATRSSIPRRSSRSSRTRESAPTRA